MISQGFLRNLVCICNTPKLCSCVRSTDTNAVRLIVGATIHGKRTWMLNGAVCYRLALLLACCGAARRTDATRAAAPLASTDLDDKRGFRY